MQTIVYLVPYLIKSGPINVLYNIVRHLDRKRFLPVIVALSDSEHLARNNRPLFEGLGIEVRCYGYSKWYCEMHSRKIARRLDEEFPESDTLFHAHGYYPTLILSRLKGRRTMTTIHNICDEDFRMTKGRWMGKYMSWKYKSSLMKLKICVAINDYMKGYYAKDTRLNIHTVCNGVEVPTVTCESERERLRTQFGIGQGTFVMIYPAAFSKRKNQTYLIEEIIARPELPIMLVLAGTGDMEEACRNIAGDDKRIRFLGYQMNLDQWWQAADALVSPSVSEGMPMAVLEAVVRGLPCLLSAIPAHLEISQNVFGTRKWCFDLKEKGKLGNLIAEAVHKKFNHGEIAEKASRLYSAEAMCKGYENLYALK